MEAQGKDSATGEVDLKAKLGPSPGRDGAHLSQRCRVEATSTSWPLGFNRLGFTPSVALSPWTSVQASQSSHVHSTRNARTTPVCSSCSALRLRTGLLTAWLGGGFSRQGAPLPRLTAPLGPACVHSSLTPPFSVVEKVGWGWELGGGIMPLQGGSEGFSEEEAFERDFTG